jgi:hypothetical protein
MHWLLILFAIFLGTPFVIQMIKNRGGDEATIPIQIFGDTYQRDENPTMYTVAVSLNYIVTFLVAVFVCYQIIQIIFSN